MTTDMDQIILILILLTSLPPAVPPHSAVLLCPPGTGRALKPKGLCSDLLPRRDGKLREGRRLTSSSVLFFGFGMYAVRSAASFVSLLMGEHVKGT